MRALVTWIWIGTGIIAFVGCKTSDRSSKIIDESSLSGDGPEDADVGGNSPVSNFGKVGPKLFRGAQLSRNEARFNFLQSVGVKNIINLQRFHRGDDPNLCAKYGMTCIHHDISPLGFDLSPIKFDWLSLKAAFADGKAALERGEGVFVHCYAGKDRTGALITALTIYPTVCSGTPYDAAMLEKAIAESYEEFGTTPTMRRFRTDVISWAKNPPSWLCQ